MNTSQLCAIHFLSFVSRKISLSYWLCTDYKTSVTKPLFEEISWSYIMQFHILTFQIGALSNCSNIKIDGQHRKLVSWLLSFYKMLSELRIKHDVLSIVFQSPRAMLTNQWQFLFAQLFLLLFLLHCQLVGKSRCMQFIFQTISFLV